MNWNDQKINDIVSDGLKEFSTMPKNSEQFNLYKKQLSYVVEKQQLENAINHTEQRLQDEIAKENGIDLDYSCDIVIEDYLDETDAELIELNKMRKQLGEM